MPSWYLVTDVGSTTTKAILIGEKGGEYRLFGAGNHPTTVEAPYEDVTVGVIGAVKDLQNRVGLPLLARKGLVRSIKDVPVTYLSTSSAGGGLQMMVFGVMRNVTADSAKKAALGGGAIVLDVVTTDDHRSTFAKLETIRRARPDMLLVSGGVDGGNTAFALEIADLLNSARPRPRFGEGYRIPVIYAGNKDAAELVADTLAESFDVKVVDNLRPSFDEEVLGPTREAIHELFMSHVMAHAPGYARLCQWVDADVVPTPVAVGGIMQTLAARRGINILGMDIGGATTDVFSVIDGALTRSVSANLGMSYSAANVMGEAGVENIVRWLPTVAPVDEVSDTVCTKLINPTSVPQTELEFQVEHALAIEALKAAFSQHKEMATVLAKGLSASSPLLGEGQVTTARPGTRTVAHIRRFGLLVGSGGVLSHAPKRSQTALILLNAFEPEGVTWLAVDSIFMMPHLGVLSGIEPDISLNVLEKDCYIPLGPAVVVQGPLSPGKPAASCRMMIGGRLVRSAVVDGGDICVLPVPEGEEVTVSVEALGGAYIGRSPKTEFTCSGSTVGVIVDARGRPLAISDDPEERARQNARWARQITEHGGDGGAAS